jgi:N-carbamoylputrescine amidase
VVLRIGAVAAHFRRDVDRCLTRIEQIIADARQDGVGLLVLPHGAIGGYHDHLGRRSEDEPASGLPPAVDLDGAEVAHVVAMAGDIVVCLGLTERLASEVADDVAGDVAGDVDGRRRANTAVCLTGDGVLGVHRKVHLPRGEETDYRPGDAIDAFDTPIGRIGMLVDYDKTFPEAARSLALDGALLVANPCAWPASRTRSTSTVRDRQRLMYDTYDAARAAENQVVLVSANQTGRHGSMRFFGSSKVVLPDGSSAASTGERSGIACADVDLGTTVGNARRTFHHLAERQPARYARLYRSAVVAP